MKNKIIIGASQYGARVNIDHSLKIIKFLFNNNFKFFDTAPLYGCGLSHFIFNRTKKKNLITTKIGQPLKLSLLEILKRIYRFNSLENFFFSFKHFYFDKRKKKKFWSKKNLELIINEYEKEMPNNIIKSIYFHRPPHKLIDKKILSDFINLSKNKKFLPGICNISSKNLGIIKNKTLTLQIDIKFYLKYYNKIKNLSNPLEIFGLFTFIKDLDDKSLNDKKKFKSFFKKKILKNNNVKILIPINNMNRAKQLVSEVKNKSYFEKILRKI